MPYRLLAEESLADGLRRISREQIDRGVGEIEDSDLGRHETVHQVRKRAKKVRAVLRLARGELEPDGTYGRENAWFRDASKTLSDVRDAEALIESFDELVAHFQEPLDAAAFEPLREELVERRRRISGESRDLDERLEAFRDRMLTARRRLADWPLERTGFAALAPGLEKSYRRARKGLRIAYGSGTAEDFHDWRKRVKYHWYHCRLLRDCWRPVVAARREEADRLADLLGDEHDLTVLRRTLADEAAELENREAIEALLGLASRRQKVLRRVARPLGERLLAEKTKHLSRRLGAYWDAWRAEGSAQPTFGQK